MLDQSLHIGVRKERCQADGSEHAVIKAQHESRNECEAAVAFEHSVGRQHTGRLRKLPSKTKRHFDIISVAPLNCKTCASIAPQYPRYRTRLGHPKGRLTPGALATAHCLIAGLSYSNAWSSRSTVLADAQRPNSRMKASRVGK